MKKSLFILGIAGGGVVIFSALKILVGHYSFSWGIFASAMVFVVALIYWFILASKSRQQG
ncbi:MAG: hypothetical protein WD431_05965 [Cyclobacteriaceae bacterium]